MEHRKPLCAPMGNKESFLRLWIYVYTRAARARITLPLDGHSGSGFAFDNEYRLSMGSRIFHSSMTPDIGITFSLWLSAPFLLSKERAFSRAPDTVYHRRFRAFLYAPPRYAKAPVISWTTDSTKSWPRIAKHRGDLATCSSTSPHIFETQTSASSDGFACIDQIGQDYLILYLNTYRLAS